jgi:hypothetical protein
MNERTVKVLIPVEISFAGHAKDFDEVSFAGGLEAILQHTENGRGPLALEALEALLREFVRGQVNNTIARALWQRYETTPVVRARPWCSKVAADRAKNIEHYVRVLEGEITCHVHDPNQA